MDMAELMATVSIKFRHGLVTKDGLRLIIPLLRQIPWQALFHPLALIGFLWVCIGVLGMKVKVQMGRG